jgi:hypothetical protein
MSSRERRMQLKLPSERATALIESVADAAAAASVAHDRAISGADAEQRAACAAQASESESNSVDRERSLTQLRRRASQPNGRSAVQTLKSESPVPLIMPLKLPRAREAALIESVADAAAAASVTPKRAISGARAEQRAACAAQASESESGSFDRERCRCCCGGERHTRQGDQQCRHRAASGLCRPSFREREKQR